jgi:hypothetical protein
MKIPVCTSQKRHINNQSQHDFMITIKTIPFVLTESQTRQATWRMKRDLATQDLQLAKDSLQRAIEHDIPIKFMHDIVLTISVRKTDLQTIIDYTETKDKESVELLKLYFADDKIAFANKWVALHK